MTQAEAGIDIQIKEVFLHVKTPDSIQAFATKLLNNKAIKLHESNKYITIIFFSLNFSFMKSTLKLLRIIGSVAPCSSSTRQVPFSIWWIFVCILEDEHGATEPIILSTFKVDFIKENFKEKKIIAMYYYQSERKMLEEAHIVTGKQIGRAHV